MGTAIVAVAAYLNPGNLSALRGPARGLGEVMAVFAGVLFLVIGIPYVTRLFLHPDAALRDMKDPTIGPLYGTLPGGILVLAAMVTIVGPALVPQGVASAIVTWLVWIGVPLAFGNSVIFAYLLFVRSEISPEAISGAWFIPPVVNIIVPMVLVPLIPGASPAIGRLLLMGAYAFWGIGALSFLLVVSLLHDRLVLHSLPPASLAPSLWIGLGPLAVGALSLVKMASAGTGVFGSAAPTIEMISRITATALWGFGLWWLAGAILLLTRYRRQGPLPYGIGWWAFTFPTGAYTVCTILLARAWEVRLVEGFGAVLFLLLTAFWIVVAGRTVWALRTGEVWRRQHSATLTSEAGVMEPRTR
jgi:C4-dicarboxylate transporter/malic acid transport protein